MSSTMVANQSNSLLLEIDQATFIFGQANLIANDYESINSSSDFGQFSFIRRYNADGIAGFVVAGFKLLCQSC